MQNGFICGARGALCGRSKSQMPVESNGMYRAPFMNIFVHDSGGFTTVAMATTLLVVLVLLFSLVSVGQVLTDSYETQSIADAGALAGENVVAKYTTVATVLDACVLSMGLTGIVALGAGLITSCVPGLQVAGAKLSQTGSSILKARRDFSQSVVKGLQAFEKIMPALIAAQSYACIRSNSKGPLHYTGAALPFPLQSKSEFGSLDSDINDEELTKKSKEIQDKTEQKEKAQKKANEAKERAWRADCGNSPSFCMYERTHALAMLDGKDNPFYNSVETWSFGVPLMRARAYYKAREVQEVIGGATGEERNDSACRKVFYQYAYEKICSGSYRENEDGTVQCSFPELPRNVQEMKETSLYTDALWPCSVEDGKTVLHTDVNCPGRHGEITQYASLSDLDTGTVEKCPYCKLGVEDMGKVASASTSIENGFEHYWKIVCDEAKIYQEALEEVAKIDKEVKKLASQSKDLFAKILKELSAIRPKLCPPGAWGCVAIATRGETELPASSISAVFAAHSRLPQGSAISGAVLAPDEATKENNVLADFFDSLSKKAGFIGKGADDIFGLWGNLLVSYGSAYKKISSQATGFLDKLDGIFSGVGTWLKGKLKTLIEGAGLQPVDMRLKRPVLTNSENILSQAGFSKETTIRKAILDLPEQGSFMEYAKVIGGVVIKDLPSEITLAEIPIPIVGGSIPIKVNIKKLLKVT